MRDVRCVCVCGTTPGTSLLVCIAYYLQCTLVSGALTSQHGQLDNLSSESDLSEKPPFPSHTVAECKEGQNPKIDNSGVLETAGSAA